MSKLAALVTPLRELGGVARRLDLAPFEECARDEVEAALVPVVERVLDVAIEGLRQIERGCAEFPDETDADDLVGWADAGPRTSTALRDVAGLAALELAGRRDELRRPQGDLWTLLERCNAARGAVVRVAAAITAMHGEAPDPFGRSHDIDSALRVRRAYCAFHARIAALGEPDDAVARPALGAARAALDALLGSPVRSELRIADRIQLLRLRQRVAAVEADDAAQHLLQEVRSVAELLRRINDREELVEHDRLVLLRAIVATYREPVDPAELDAIDLAAIAGRDNQLDAVVAGGVARTSAGFATAVTRAALRLDPPATTGIVVGT